MNLCKIGSLLKVLFHLGTKIARAKAEFLQDLSLNASVQDSVQLVYQLAALGRQVAVLGLFV